MRCAVPFRASVRDLLTDLLARKVVVTDADPFVLTEERRALLASYRFDDGTVAAAAVCDVPLAASAGAAIAMTPADEVEHDDGLDDETKEFFHEVVNVFAKLLNSPTTPHVVLREMHTVPGRVPADVAGFVLEPGGRFDYRVSIEGYGAGTMVVLTG